MSEGDGRVAFEERGASTEVAAAVGGTSSCSSEVVADVLTRHGGQNQGLGHYLKCNRSALLVHTEPSMKHGWVISSTAPPIIRDAVAISEMSDMEGGHSACNGPAQVKGNSGQRFEGTLSIGLRCASAHARV